MIKKAKKCNQSWKEITSESSYLFHGSISRISKKLHFRKQICRVRSLTSLFLPQRVTVVQSVLAKIWRKAAESFLSDSNGSLCQLLWNSPSSFSASPLLPFSHSLSLPWSMSCDFCHPFSSLPSFSVVMANPLRFLGNSLLQWNNLATVAASVPWHVELMFRTRQASSTLLHISSGLQHNLTLQVRATYPKRASCQDRSRYAI